MPSFAGLSAFLNGLGSVVSEQDLALASPLPLLLWRSPTRFLLANLTGST